MLLKWIIATVEPERRAAFSHAQRAWSRLVGIDGFIAQVGGWNRSDPREACLLAAWEGDATHRAFMATGHDAIFRESGQAETYAALSTSFWVRELDMTSRADALSGGAGRGAVVLRMEHGRLRAGRAGHFLATQRELWAPALAGIGSVPGGMVGRAADGSDAYLQATLWDSEPAHDDYVQTLLPTLRRRADLAHDVETMTGRIVSLVPEWTVASRPRS